MPTKKQDSNRKYYLKNKDALLVRARKYHQDHKDQCRKYNKKYNQEHKDRSRKWAKNHPEDNKFVRIKSVYGLSRRDYEKLEERQEYKCAICGIEAWENGKRLSIDHDHLTEKIRGLLCRSCNVGLGCFADDTSLMRKAIAYIEEHDGKPDCD